MLHPVGPRRAVVESTPAFVRFQRGRPESFTPRRTPPPPARSLFQRTVTAHWNVEAPSWSTKIGKVESAAAPGIFGSLLVYLSEAEWTVPQNYIGKRERLGCTPGEERASNRMVAAAARAPSLRQIF